MCMASFMSRTIVPTPRTGDAASRDHGIGSGSPGSRQEVCVLDKARMAVDAATRASADYADARLVTEESESLTVKNQEMEGIDRAHTEGVGIRVLVNGFWGFAATARLDEQEIVR